MKRLDESDMGITTEETVAYSKNGYDHGTNYCLLEIFSIFLN